MTSNSHSLPRITVLLPTKNRRKNFEHMLDMLLQEKYEHPNVEIVVIDGDSTDGTTDIIKRHAHEIVVCKSQKLNIYSALNAGLAMAKGEWVRMVADDDMYVPGVLPVVMKAMEQHPKSLGVGGGYTSKTVSRDGSIIVHPSQSMSGVINRKTISDASSHILFAHEAMFFRREPLLSIGGWSERFAVSGDIDLLYRLLDTGGYFFVLPTVVIHMVHSENSISVRGSIRGLLETVWILLKSRQWSLLVRLLIHCIWHVVCRACNAIR